jgi:hypothetical protein
MCRHILSAVFVLTLCIVGEFVRGRIGLSINSIARLTGRTVRTEYTYVPRLPLEQFAISRPVQLLCTLLTYLITYTYLSKIRYVYLSILIYKIDLKLSILLCLLRTRPTR